MIKQVLLVAAATVATMGSALAGSTQPTPIPEPETLALFGMGAAAVIAIRYFRRK